MDQMSNSLDSLLDERWIEKEVDESKEKRLTLSEEVEIARDFPPEFAKKMLREKTAALKERIRKLAVRENLYREELNKLIEAKEAGSSRKLESLLLTRAYADAWFSTVMEPLRDRLARLEFIGISLDTTKKKKSKDSQRETDWKRLTESARQQSIVRAAEMLGIPLKRSGRVYFCRCRYNEDRHPSCCLYPDSNSFHCYSCGNHGDVISFYMTFTGADFKEAVKALGKI